MMTSKLYVAGLNQASSLFAKAGPDPELFATCVFAYFSEHPICRMITFAVRMRSVNIQGEYASFALWEKVKQEALSARFNEYFSTCKSRTQSSAPSMENRAIDRHIAINHTADVIASG